MKRIIPGTLLLIFSTLMVACGGAESAMSEMPEPAADKNDASPLVGTFWNLTALNGGELLPSSAVTAEFNEENVVAGSSGCNNYMGSYETDGNEITMGPFGTTRKLCPDPIMEQERLYLATLERAATYSIEGNTMNMRTAEGATVANFQRMESPTESASVSGSVTNVDDAPIPEGATLTVQIQDTSKQDVAATVMGEQVIADPGQFPIPYEVTYNPSDIASPTYTMSARITASDGSLLFINDTAIRVITNGATEDVEIPVIQIGG